MNKIHDISEFVLDDILVNHFDNKYLMNIVSDTLDNIIKYQSHEKLNNQYTVKSIQQYLTKILKLKNKSIYCDAMFCSYKTKDKMLFIKTPKNNDDNLNLLYDTSMNIEYDIMKLCLNKIRNKTPNFMFGFSVFSCGNVKKNKICEDEYSSSKYLLCEAINGISFKEFIQTHNKTHDNINKILKYITQVALSLKIAQNKYCFIHNDLHIDNIIIKPLNETKTLVYKIDDVEYLIETDAIATIIDFGLSRCINEDKIITNVTEDMFDKNYNVTGDKAYTGIDMFKFLFNILHISISLKNNTLHEYIRDIIKIYLNIHSDDDLMKIYNTSLKNVFYPQSKKYLYHDVMNILKSFKNDNIYTTRNHTIGVLNKDNFKKKIFYYKYISKHMNIHIQLDNKYNFNDDKINMFFKSICGINVEYVDNNVSEETIKILSNIIKTSILYLKESPDNINRCKLFITTIIMMKKYFVSSQNTDALLSLNKEKYKNIYYRCKNEIVLNNLLK